MNISVRARERMCAFEALFVPLNNIKLCVRVSALVLHAGTGTGNARRLYICTGTCRPTGTGTGTCRPAGIRTRRFIEMAFFVSSLYIPVPVGNKD